MLLYNRWHRLLNWKVSVALCIHIPSCGSSPASQVEQRPVRFLLKGVVHETTFTVKCTWLGWTEGEEEMEKALVFNGGTNCTSHSNGICTEGKSSSTYIEKTQSSLCKEPLNYPNMYKIQWINILEFPKLSSSTLINSHTTLVTLLPLHKSPHTECR